LTGAKSALYNALKNTTQAFALLESPEYFVTRGYIGRREVEAIECACTRWRADPTSKQRRRNSFAGAGSMDYALILPFPNRPLST
jgi:hypothetical protein